MQYSQVKEHTEQGYDLMISVKEASVPTFRRVKIALDTRQALWRNGTPEMLENNARHFRISRQNDHVMGGST